MDKKFIEHPVTSTKNAQQRATENFYKKNRTLKVDLSIDFFNTVEDYCKQQNMTKREFIEHAASEYMDNH